MTNLHPPSLPSQPRGPLVVAGIIIALLALNWVAAVARFQVDLLYWDQWDYSAPLFEGKGALALFTQQHGPHRQGVAFVLSSWVMEASGWDSRWESLWIASLLVIAAVLAVIWKRRATGRFGWGDLWLPAAALAMRQYETVIVVPNASHSIFPLVLLLLAALGLTRPPTTGRWLVLGLIGAAALFTGFGIFVWAGLGWVAGLRVVHALGRRNPQSGAGAALAAVVLLGALAWFAAGYVFNPASPGATFPHWPLGDYPRFVILMLASRMDLVLPTAGAYAAGAVMLVLGTAAVVHASWRVACDPRPAPGLLAAAYLLVAGLGFAWFTTSGRVHLGLEAAMAPRYTSLMLAWWLGLVAWAAAHGGRIARRGATVLGWAMVVAPWPALADREWQDWPGTLGMSLQSRDAMSRTQGLKSQWLMAWQETGDWRAAEHQVPQGIHPRAEAADLGRKIAWMRERELSFTTAPEQPWSWLPWWNPLGVTWLEGTGGEHAQWMASRARLLIEGRPSGYLNLRVQWVAQDFGPDHPFDIELGPHRARMTYEDMLAGVSIPLPPRREVLVLRSPDGTVPLDPPRDPREGSFLVEDPTASREPRFARRGWMDDAPGLWPEHTLRVVDGLHRWEGEGAWVWTQARLAVECRAIEPAFLNVAIESRYGPVNEGPVLLRIDGIDTKLTWSPDGLRFAVPVAAGRAVAVELRNPAGDRSPQEAGESGDPRRLALRLTRLSLEAEAAYPVPHGLPGGN